MYASSILKIKLWDNKPLSHLTLRLSPWCHILWYSIVVTLHCTCIYPEWGRPQVLVVTHHQGNGNGHSTDSRVSKLGFTFSTRKGIFPSRHRFLNMQIISLKYFVGRKNCFQPLWMNIYKRDYLFQTRALGRVWKRWSNIYPHIHSMYIVSVYTGDRYTHVVNTWTLWKLVCLLFVFE